MKYGCNSLIRNGTNRARTCDLMRVKHALFQLSYDPEPLNSNSLSGSHGPLFSCVHMNVHTGKLRQRVCRLYKPRVNSCRDGFSADDCGYLRCTVVVGLSLIGSTVNIRTADLPCSSRLLLQICFRYTRHQ